MNYVSDIARRILAELPADQLPQGDTHLLMHLYALLALAKGQDVTGKDVHDAWAVWQSVTGTDHESLKPYGDLSASVKAEDSPFMMAIRKVGAELEEESARPRE